MKHTGGLERFSSNICSVLCEGMLEKFKDWDSIWWFRSRKLSATWVLRYYVLRHMDGPDPDAFFLEQYEDATPLSKVHKKLDLRRVMQVDTNISFQVGSQEWIIAIHYCSKRGDKLKQLYLAAHSKADMDRWIAKLCEACNLKGPDDIQTDENVNSSGSSSSTCSSLNSSTSAINHSTPDLSSKVLQKPPPRPPKPSPDTCKKIVGSEGNGSHPLRQQVPPPVFCDASEVSDERWSDETICADQGSTNISTSSIDEANLRPSVAITPKPLPRLARNYQNLPPEIDRSCKPGWGLPKGRRISVDNMHDQGGGVRSAGNSPWKCSSEANVKLANKKISGTFQNVPQTRDSNCEVSPGLESMHAYRLTTSTPSALDYLDPLESSLMVPKIPQKIKRNRTPKMSTSTEYVHIDEESTKAVLESNMQQSHLRRDGFQML